MRPGANIQSAGVVYSDAANRTMIARRAQARTGIAPAHLLDVQTASGDVYHWSDRKLANVPGVILSDAEAATGLATYSPWLLDVGDFSFNRSTITDTGQLRIQNLSGDVLQSDWEKIVRGGTLEGALFVYRYFAIDLGFAWIEQHGTLSVSDTDRIGAQITLYQLVQGQDDTPQQQISETCQLNWGEARCGASTANGAVECLYTFMSCQVPEHFVGIQTAFETNNPEAVAQLPQQPLNRARPW